GRRSAMLMGVPPRPVPTSSMCVEYQAAPSSSGVMPASAMASLYASSMRSSGLASQRSPNLLQPMPRMATLSLMPVAMGGSLIRCESAAHGRRLPEIAGEAATLVDVLDAEHHLHRRARIDLADVDVGEVHQDAAAAFEIDLAVVVRRSG